MSLWKRLLIMFWSIYTFCITATEVATCNNRRMVGSSKPAPSDWDTKSAMPGPPLSYCSEMLHSQADSFLMAARLVRRGWPNEGTKTNRQLSQSDGSARQPIFTSSEGHKASVRVRICRKDPMRSWTLDMSSGETSLDGKTGFEKDDKAKETSEDAASPNRPEERQTGVVYVWKSSCRITCRQTRRFKAPVLPAIAEVEV